MLVFQLFLDHKSPSHGISFLAKLQQKRSPKWESRYKLSTFYFAVRESAHNFFLGRPSSFCAEECVHNAQPLVELPGRMEGGYIPHSLKMLPLTLTFSHSNFSLTGPLSPPPPTTFSHKSLLLCTTRQNCPIFSQKSARGVGLWRSLGRGLQSPWLIFSGAYEKALHEKFYYKKFHFLLSQSLKLLLHPST